MSINIDHSRDSISASNTANILTIAGTGALAIPVGNTSQRPQQTIPGQLRFNTTTQGMEVSDGSNWSDLTGSDLDKDTYIKYETSTGSDEDTIYFYNANTLSATLDSTAFDTNKITVVDVEVSNTLDVTVTATLASASVTDLTDTRIVYAGASGELQDSANLTFDGTTLSSTFAGDLTGDVTGNLTGDVTGNVTGDVTGNIFLNDSHKIKLGDGPDLEIYHNGTDSFIDDVGAGSIFIRSGTIYLQNAAGTKTSIQTNAGAGQTLYFNNSPKFETTTNGVTITGSITGDLIGDITAGTITDGTLTISSGSITGATAITASNTITANTFTDSVLSITNGNITSATTVTSDTITGTTITDGTLSIANGIITDAVDATFSGDISVGGDVTISGDLTVQGTTTTVNSTTTSIVDPIMFIGGNADGTPLTVDDNKDRGVAFEYHNGTSAKTGFFGWDDSAEKFTMIADATITSDVASGSVGNFILNDLDSSTINVETINVSTEAYIIDPNNVDPDKRIATAIVTSSTVPTSGVKEGDLWVDSDSLNLYMYSNSVWVPLSPGIASSVNTNVLGLTDLSVTVNSVGTANLTYDNTTGIFSFTPPDLSSYATQAGLTTLTNSFNTHVASLSAVALSGDYGDLLNKPTLSTVANTGDYGDLLNAPSVPVNLADLSNIDNSNPGNGQVLKYNGTTGKWQPATDNTSTATGGVLGFGDLTVSVQAPDTVNHPNGTLTYSGTGITKGQFSFVPVNTSLFAKKQNADGVTIEFGDAQDTKISYIRSSNVLDIELEQNATGIQVTDNGTPVFELSKTGNLEVTGDFIGTGSIASVTTTVPSSNTDTGTKGQIAYDASYVYICVATNTWIRSAIDNSF